MTTSIIFLARDQFTDLIEPTQIDFDEGQQDDDAVVGMQRVVYFTSVNDVTDVFVVLDVKAYALSEVDD
jgi:hypothetical protein